MKSKVQWIVALSALVTLCSCGVESSEQSKSQIKDDPKQVTAVETAVFTNGKTSVKTSPIENDYIRIDWDYFDDDGFLYWENLDGTGKQEIKIDKEIAENELFWLTNDWLYYATEDDTESTIGRIPFDHKAQPMFDIGNKELLIENTCAVTDMIVTDTYLFYCGYKSKSDYYCYGYDLGSKKNTEIVTTKCGVDDELRILYATAMNGSFDLPIVLEDRFFIIDKGAIFSVSTNTLEAKKIYSGEDMDDECLVAEYDGAIYLVTDGYDNIYKCDGDKTECLVTGKNFHKIIEDMNLVDQDSLYSESYIEDFGIENDRFYALTVISWRAKEKYVEGPHKGETIERWHSREVLLSTDITDFSNWKLADTMADFISDHLRSRKEKVFDSCHASYYKTDRDFKHSMEVSSVVIDGLYDGKAWFSNEFDMNIDVEDHSYYTYNLATEKIQQVDEDTYIDIWG